MSEASDPKRAPEGAGEPADDAAAEAAAVDALGETTSDVAEDTLAELPRDELLQTVIASVGSDHDPMVSIRPDVLEESTVDRVATIRLAPGGRPDVAPGAALELDLDLDSLDLQSASVNSPDATQSSGTHNIPVFEDAGAVPELAPSYGYELQDLVGTGGMGEVWRARQRSLWRLVALKRLRPGKTASKQFESEARFAGALEHPNIVTIYEYGQDQAQRDFYTMKMIEGRPWSELIREGRRRKRGIYVLIELREHLETLAEVAQAIAFAHSRDIIHRDIKPGNVMIGDFGEKLVVDWGLAVAVAEREELGGADTWTVAKLPKSALICGTPAYMAPETAAAKRELIGKATDVYLLGAVLFHLLYGRPPHKGASLEEVMAKAKVNAFAFPRVIPGRVKPWDALLRPVITRALATQPSARYADASEFHDALQEALSNYDSAKIASRAQEKLAQLGESGNVTAAGYEPLVAIIAQLDGALESWPRNLVARQTLAQAHLELAALALDNGDVGLAKVNLDAFERLPPLPEPAADEQPARRLTLHPVDGTLVSAPRPTDSLMAGGSAGWLSGVLSGGSRSRSASGSGRAPSRGAFAATVNAAGGAEEVIARARQVSASHAKYAASEATGSVGGSVASVQIQQDSSASMVSEDQRMLVRAMGLSARLEAREADAQRRRRSMRIIAGVSGLMVCALLIAITSGFVGVRKQKDRAANERDALSYVLLAETHKTVEARLQLGYRPVLAALGTAATWTEAGELDSNDPEDLNRLLMPLLDGVPAASSMLRADTEGYEYMLVDLEPAKGWRTRSTAPDSGSQLREWTRAGDLREGEGVAQSGYDPREHAWYLNGAKLRSEARRAVERGVARPVSWTEPYALDSTGQLGLSVSTPASSEVTRRAYVLAMDVRLDVVSRLTMSLPEGIESGQVFVLDEQMRILGLPRELDELDDAARAELMLTPIDELDAAPISQAGYRAWAAAREAGDEGLVHLAGEGEETYIVSIEQLGAPELPELWIGVIVPESHFLP